MMSEPSRLACLRAGTRDAHTSIETVPALARLVSAELTRDLYATVLQHMHAFHAHVEPAIAAALEAWPLAAAMLDGTRPRALADDLAWFGVAAMAPPQIAAPESAEAALGALYVIEGSGLGGRVIARHLTDHLGVRPGSGGSFYGGLSADAARARWQRLCTLLEQPLDAAADALVDGARETFRALETWLRRIDVSAATDTHAFHLMAEAVAPAVVP